MARGLRQLEWAVLNLGLNSSGSLAILAAIRRASCALDARSKWGAVAAGELTPMGAAELSKVVDGYARTLQQSVLDFRLRHACLHTGSAQRIDQQACNRHRPDSARHRRDRPGDLQRFAKIHIAHGPRFAIRVDTM